MSGRFWEETVFDEINLQLMQTPGVVRGTCFGVRKRSREPGGDRLRRNERRQKPKGISYNRSVAGMDENPYQAPLGMPSAAFPPVWVMWIPAAVLKIRSLYSLTDWLALTAITAVLVALILPVVQAAREASRRCQHSNSVKQIAPNASTPASKPVVAPSAVPENARELTRFKVPESVLRVLKMVRKKAGGMLWAFNWLVRQPLWFLAMVYILAVGLLMAPRATRPTADRARA